MNPLAPNTTPADAQGAFAILSLLTNDSAYKKRLEELQTYAANADQQTEAARVQVKDAAEKTKVADAALYEAQRLTAEATAKLKAAVGKEQNLQALELAYQERKAELDSNFAKAFAARDKEVSTIKAALQAKEVALGNKAAGFETSVTQHNAMISAKEDALVKREALLVQNEATHAGELKAARAEIDSIRASLLAKLDKLKSISAD